MTNSKKYSSIGDACFYCANNIKEIDYKNVESLIPFISGYKKILPRKKTKLCAKHQRKFSMSVKRARIMALLPFTNR